jgi:hypothetical protein
VAFGDVDQVAHAVFGHRQPRPRRATRNDPFAQRQALAFACGGVRALVQVGQAGDRTQAGHDRVAPSFGAGRHQLQHQLFAISVDHDSRKAIAFTEEQAHRVGVGGQGARQPCRGDSPRTR